MKQINNIPDRVQSNSNDNDNRTGKIIDEHSENVNNKLENIKKNQSEVKNTITEMKSTLEGINSRLGDTEECISYLKDKIMETAQSEQYRENQILKNEDSLRALWNNFKYTNFHILRVPKGEQKEKEVGTYLVVQWLRICLPMQGTSV